MTYIVFENTGEFDLRLLKTFGVNAKVNDNPIGYFGTGLKYAAAVVLRNGGEFYVQDGCGEQFVLRVAESRIRGKTFPLVTIRCTTAGASVEQELPFTTELGKNWAPWQAYRELYSNALDEKGRRYLADHIPPPRDETVRFIVKGGGMNEAYSKHNEVFFEQRPPLIGLNSEVEVYDSPSNVMYFRGIKIYESKQAFRYTYNITSQIHITEDRTSAWEYERHDAIKTFWADTDNVYALERFITLDNTWYEYNVDMSSMHLGSTFLEVAERMLERHYMKVREGIRRNVHGRRAEKTKFHAHPLTSVQEKMLERGKAILEQFGYDMGRYPIVPLKSLGGNVMGMADDGKIYVCQLAFDKGMKQVVATLLEEWIHLEFLVKDCTREMQDILFDKIVNFMEEKLGEPI